LHSTSLQLRISELLGESFANSLIPVQEDSSIVKIKGFISKPGFTKKSKQDQFFFLNKRFFTNKNLNFAVYSGYEQLIEKGDYPSFFLFIDIDPKKVDVNVHPSKLEVKFEDESAMFGFLRRTISNTLKVNDLTFDIGFGSKIGFENQSESLEHSTPKSFSGISNENFNFRTSTGEKDKSAFIHSIFQASRQENTEDEPIDALSADTQSNIFQHTKKEDKKFNLWQYQNKYVMCETETGLMIIDQHAAHERILYEKATLMLNSQSSFSQHLLLPLKIQLTKIDFQLAKSLQEEIHNLGFDLKFTENEIVEIKGIPADVKPGDENKILQELIDQYKEYEIKLHLEKRDNLAKSFACRSAVKSGEHLHKEEMENLIDALFATNMPYVCPHGRPTVIRITTEELDKRFSRT